MEKRPRLHSNAKKCFIAKGASTVRLEAPETLKVNRPEESRRRVFGYYILFGIEIEISTEEEYNKCVNSRIHIYTK